METKHVQQPIGSSLCGHSCVAMALGMSLDEAIGLVGHRRGMRNHELVKALGGAALFQRSVRAVGPPFDPSVMRVKGPRSRWHLVLYRGGAVYDPGLSFPIPSLAMWEDLMVKQRGWRIVSFFPLMA